MMDDDKFSAEKVMGLVARWERWDPSPSLNEIHFYDRNGNKIFRLMRRFIITGHQGIIPLISASHMGIHGWIPSEKLIGPLQLIIFPETL